MKQHRRHHSLIIAALLFNVTLSFAVEPEVKSTEEWPAALKKKGYAPFLANTMQRLNETKAIAPGDVIDTVVVSIAKGE